VDADGKPVLDDDGSPVKGILPLGQDEADALAQARHHLLDGATVGGITRNWNTRGILTVRSRRDWPFLRDVAKQVARSHKSWPIRRSALPILRRPTWWC
jgi:hypothetical protein